MYCALGSLALWLPAEFSQWEASAGDQRAREECVQGVCPQLLSCRVSMDWTWPEGHSSSLSSLLLPQSWLSGLVPALLLLLQAEGATISQDCVLSHSTHICVIEP
jgi:hypothetical protein